MPSKGSSDVAMLLSLATVVSTRWNEVERGGTRWNEV
jgi:hypothetical protein